MLSTTIIRPRQRRSAVVALLISTVALVASVLQPPPSAGAQNAKNDRPLALLEPADGVLFGAWPASEANNRDRSSAAVSDFESITNSRLDIVHTFEPPHQPAWDLQWANWVLDSGRIPMITWRVGPEVAPTSGDNAAQRVVNGDFDTQIRARAAQAKMIEGPFFSRLFHEMDGSTGQQYDLTPDLFDAYWRRIRAIFKEEGVRNAAWVWNVAALQPGEEDWYPGDDVVDWIAADPFQWVGEHPDPSKERGDCRTNTPSPISERLGETFWQFSDDHPDKPIMLGEWGSGTRTGSSARVDYINSLSDAIDANPRLKAVVYFHSSSGGCGWRLDQGHDVEGAAMAYANMVNGRQAKIGPLLDRFRTKTICAGLLVTVDIGLGEKPTGGDDVIVGTEGRDKIKAGGGNDVVCALGGDDRVVAGAGDDKVYSGPGSDVVIGGKGADRLYGSAGDDRLRGGKGQDELRGGSGNDQLSGDAGADRIFGQGGNDTMKGGAGRDLLDGGEGRDSAHGGAGKESPAKRGVVGCFAEEKRAC